MSAMSAREPLTVSLPVAVVKRQAASTFGLIDPTGKSTSIFTRATAVWGLASAVLMTVPTNFGQVGMAFAMVSLVPSSVFALLVWRRLLHLDRPAVATAETRDASDVA